MNVYERKKFRLDDAFNIGNRKVLVDVLCEKFYLLKSEVKRFFSEAFR